MDLYKRVPDGDDKWCGCDQELVVVNGPDGWYVGRVCHVHKRLKAESMPVGSSAEAHAILLRLAPGIDG